MDTWLLIGSNLLTLIIANIFNAYNKNKELKHLKKLKKNEFQHMKETKEKELQNQKDLLYIEIKSQFSHKLIEKKLNAYIETFNFIQNTIYSNNYANYLFSIWIYKILPYCNSTTKTAIDDYLQAYMKVEPNLIDKMKEPITDQKDFLIWFINNVRNPLIPFLEKIERSMREEVLEIYAKNSECILNDERLKEEIQKIII